MKPDKPVLPRLDRQQRLMAIGLVLISSCGFCITNGFPELPW